MKRIMTVLAVAALMAMMLVVTASVALAASNQSCSNWNERNDRFHDLQDQNQTSGLDRAHSKNHDNQFRVCSG